MFPRQVVPVYHCLEVGAYDLAHDVIVVLVDHRVFFVLAESTFMWLLCLFERIIYPKLFLVYDFSFKLVFYILLFLPLRSMGD